MRLHVSCLVASIAATALIVACVGDLPAGGLTAPAEVPDATSPVQADASVVAPPSDGGTGGADAAAPDTDAAADASIADAGGPGADAAADAGPPCDRRKPFGLAGRLIALGSAAYQPQLTPDELTIFFSRATAVEDAGVRRRIFIARRASTADRFEAPTEVTGLGTMPTHDDHGLFLLPRASAGSRVLFLSSVRGLSSQDYYRVDADRGFTTFGIGSMIPVLSTGGLEGGATFTADAGGMYFTRVDYPDGSASGRGVLYRAALDPSLGATEVVRVPGFEARDVPDGFAAVTPDDLALYFSTLTADGWRMQVARRSVTTDPFGPPERLDSLAGTPGTSSYVGWVSPDECRIYFARGVDAESEIYVAERPR